ncbi:hypothetical protein L227DRAFT_405942 [Lentinus tigrinus ALCF2SS1-6]|uniref:Uncharacterized protein n=1 Tax=Lentinus tigrinus ALCF2SS1-6 TaxID=1328759 RepID=A0A5C2RRU2_9APHY|nr:hypothetical protein L227DRAFT_405942 [Lentinus tigrinus ALCF2SS1-6]
MELQGVTGKYHFILLTLRAPYARRPAPWSFLRYCTLHGLVMQPVGGPPFAISAVRATCSDSLFLGRLHTSAPITALYRCLCCFRPRRWGPGYELRVSRVGNDRISGCYPGRSRKLTVIHAFILDGGRIVGPGTSRSSCAICMDRGHGPKIH